MSERQDNQAFFTPAEVAERWKVSGQTIINECRRGRLKHIRIGRLVRIHAQAVAAAERAGIPDPIKAEQQSTGIPDEIGN